MIKQMFALQVTRRIINLLLIPRVLHVCVSASVIDRHLDTGDRVLGLRYGITFRVLRRYLFVVYFERLQ